MSEQKAVRLKASFISEDGKTFLCIRQFYLNDLSTGELINGQTLQGKKFRLIETEVKEGNHE